MRYSLGATEAFWLFAVILIALMGTAQILSIRQEAQTWDEAMHLAAGYSYWKTGSLRINPEHPPLGKYLNTLPLLALNPALPPVSPLSTMETAEFGRQFLYSNTVDADKLLFAGRAVSVAMTLTGGLLLALWVRRRFGAPTALFALGLYCFEPNLIAHGRYITSDIFVTVFFFLACVTWGEHLVTGRRSWLAFAGISLGLAVTSKFSALLLAPIFVLLCGLRCWQQWPSASVWRALRSLLIVGALACVTIIAVYAPEAHTFLPGMRGLDRSLPAARDAIDTRTNIGRAMYWACNRLGLARNSFLEGISIVAGHTATGHPAYLLGAISRKGWWYYFPVALAVKTPTGLLLGLAVSFELLVRRAGRWREVAFEWFVVSVPPAAYFAASMAFGLNIGVRHVLPVYPFLGILMAAVLWKLGHWRILTGLAAVVALESALVFPYYLAFFNLPSGGPGYGPHYLVDSNIDWGQDLRRLKRYLDSQRVDIPCFSYFGSAPPDYYGIHDRSLPTTAEVRDGQIPNCLAAISVTPLMGLYVDDKFAWLRKMRPVAKIGYSIYVYDFRARRSSHQHSAQYQPGIFAGVM